ncbi:MAG TPA: indole-3-glycerol phosphate synthase TrpC [bacterium]|nr:indole-3-glycerol phosphate synthase TrpC [bacterium]
MSILTRIAETKKEEVARLKRERGLASLKEGAASQAPARDFAAAIQRPGKLSLIAELKKASPSKGVLREDFRIEPLAEAYAAGGAQALSVLTDVPYFQGSLSYLPLAKKASGLPVLRKDFIVDELQVLEAREAGADAILLIAAMLTPSLMKELKALAAGLGMASLIEVHDERELEVALAIQPKLLGINNRDLNDFSVTLQTTFDLAPKCPQGTVLVSESGIFKKEDCLKVQKAGVSAVLVGEAFMTAPDVEGAVRALMP